MRLEVRVSLRKSGRENWREKKRTRGEPLVRSERGWYLVFTAIGSWLVGMTCEIHFTIFPFLV